jgi:hypothetical protein
MRQATPPRPARQVARLRQQLHQQAELPHSSHVSHFVSHQRLVRPTRLRLGR